MLIHGHFCAGLIPASCAFFVLVRNRVLVAIGSLGEDRLPKTKMAHPVLYPQAVLLGISVTEPVAARVLM
jgi:hypothetical protein